MTLTLEEAARLALARNPTIRAAAARLEQSRQRVEVEAAPGRPQVSLSAGRLVQQTVKGPPIEATVFGVRETFRQESALFTSTEARLQVRQLLFDGGRLAARLDHLRSSTGQAEQELVAAWHRLFRDVCLAYYDALEARAREVAAAEALEVAEQQLRLAQARFRAGAAARADVVYARVPVSRNQLERDRAHHRSLMTAAALNRLMGLEQDTPLELREPQDPGPVPGDLEACLAAARKQRPELQALRAELSAARKALEAATLATSPRLDAVGDLRAAGYERDLFPTSAGWRVGLEVTWPILEGNRTAHQVAQARAAVEEAEARLEDLHQQVELQVRQAYLAVDAAARAYRTARLQVERAREALNVARGQYRAGVAPFLQVSEAHLEFLQARTDRLATYYDYLRARARLYWARGDDPGVTTR